MKRRALIVDDEEAVRRVLSRRLSEKGWSVMWAENAEDAIFLASSGEYGLILLDIELPGMTGLEALPLIKDRSDAAILLMSGDAGEETRKDAVLLGAADMASKPMDFSALDAFVEKFASP